ncbi:YgiT-type zinc finger protein [Sphaerospermopsis torques-reginae]|jgi:YgiT-type zinc finger domain-containing protein|uniref:YgiT-type zinc finger protein n=1 Tax=Sphaerospermopsis torques-reginae ITEP-024 TaxID=984208 RepID=A0ABX8X5C9_9CYAN|nr:YgiT-type zinc finger protein [Sphaerospermopsis torques-reginae]QYX33706.1 YgiT-type zinc finger protein [Sphaerospermopsis torques-reginae ITEP-024]
MLPIDKCVICNGNLLETKVTEIIKGGGNTATLQVNALVCQNCGERFYHADTIRRFENIKLKLERQETQDLIPVGQSFEVA